MSEEDVGATERIAKNCSGQFDSNGITLGCPGAVKKGLWICRIYVFEICYV